MSMVVGGLWVLALARVTRLLTRDEITDFIRAWVFGRWGFESKLGYFVRCPWCVSMWLSFATLWPVFILTGADWRLYPFTALAGSYVVGVFAENLESDDDFDVEIQDEDH